MGERRDGAVDPAVVAALADGDRRKEARRSLGQNRSIGSGRKTPVRPSEVRRRDRQLSVTFSSADIPERLRGLARAWGWVAPDGESPAVSRVVEFLLLPGLQEEAEAAGLEGVESEVG